MFGPFKAQEGAPKFSINYKVNSSNKKNNNIITLAIQDDIKIFSFKRRKTCIANKESKIHEGEKKQ